jgi:hypothetical protein
MSHSAVQEILNRIQNLSDQEREDLESRWTALLDEEWQKEMEQARTLARNKGLNQEQIDQAIHRMRYGS